MGVECTAMTYVGKYVEDGEAYLVEKGILKENEAEDYYGGDLKYAYNTGQIPLCVQQVSYYSDEGAYVGFEVDISDYKDFDALLAKFKELTGEEGSVEAFSHWH